MEWGLHQYGKVYDAWPKLDSGEPEPPAFLTHCASLDMEADLISSMLESYGVPSVMQYPGNGAFGKVMLGISGNGVDLYVPASRLSEAQDLLKGEPEDVGLQEGV